MKDLVNELKQNPYEAVEFLIWGLFLYFFIYLGFIGFDNIEESVYYLVESLIG